MIFAIKNIVPNTICVVFIEFCQPITSLKSYKYLENLPNIIAKTIVRISIAMNNLHELIFANWSAMPTIIVVNIIV